MLVDLLDLADQAWAFSQRSLLDRDTFIKHCEQRGLQLDTAFTGRDKLEALHRAGVLVPLFRIDRLPAARAIAKQDHMPLCQAFDWVGIFPLAGHRSAGTLHDPAREEYLPWSRYQRRFPEGYHWTSTFLYSPYQLLLIPLLQRIERYFRCTVKRNPRRCWWRLALPEYEQQRVTREVQDLQGLLVALSLLEARYYPSIPNTGRSHLQDAFELIAQDGNLTQTYQSFCERFNPGDELARLDWVPECCILEARKLLALAERIDPLAKWQDLIRLCHWDKISTLRGAALTAYDVRTAAEILLRCYEDLAGRELAVPLHESPSMSNAIKRDRLNTDGSDVDSVLMEYGLSPHPSLVIVVEGETEQFLVPRVMRFLGLNPDGPEVRVFLYGSVDANDHLLVRYVSSPEIGLPLRALGGDMILPFTRPPTRLLRLTDPEGRLMKTAAEREKWRSRLLGQILKELPEVYQTPEIRSQLEEHVQVECWDETYPFEFAHFTDEEIASVLDVEPEEVRFFREHEKRNLDLAWLWANVTRKTGVKPVGRITSKVVLAGALWPTLEAKMRRAIDTHNVDDVPVLRICLRAAEIVDHTHRRQVGLVVANQQRGTQPVVAG